jgi:hypothetical protein
VNSDSDQGASRTSGVTSGTTPRTAAVRSDASSAVSTSSSRRITSSRPNSVSATGHTSGVKAVVSVSSTA